MRPTRASCWIGVALLALAPSSCGERAPVALDATGDASVDLVLDTLPDVLHDAGADVDPCASAGVGACRPEGLTCTMEGQPYCNYGPPPGGSCRCKAGQWACWSSCHMDCPLGSAPQGTPCSFDDDEGICRYAHTTCHCIDGKYACGSS